MRRRGIGFASLHQVLETTTPGERLVSHVFAALAEFVRELIVEGAREGLEAARARGQRLGRPPALTPEQVRYARALSTRPENSVSLIARLLRVSRSTVCKHVPELARERQLIGAYRVHTMGCFGRDCARWTAGACRVLLWHATQARR